MPSMITGTGPMTALRQRMPRTTAVLSRSGPALGRVTARTDPLPGERCTSSCFLLPRLMLSLLVLGGDGELMTGKPCTEFSKPLAACV